MNPVKLILTALAAGAALGRQDAASSQAKDAYNRLLALVRKRLTDRRYSDLVLARYQEAPATWKARLEAELAAAHVGADTDLVEAAHVVMDLIDEAGSRAGKYNLSVHGSQGAQFGGRQILPDST